MIIKTADYGVHFKRLKLLAGGKTSNIAEARKKLISIRDCLTCIISISCDDIAKINGVLKGGR